MSVGAVPADTVACLTVFTVNMLHLMLWYIVLLFFS